MYRSFIILLYKSLITSILHKPSIGLSYFCASTDSITILYSLTFFLLTCCTFLAYPLSLVWKCKNSRITENREICLIGRNFVGKKRRKNRLVTKFFTDEYFLPAKFSTDEYFLPTKIFSRRIFFPDVFGLLCSLFLLKTECFWCQI